MYALAYAELLRLASIRVAADKTIDVEEFAKWLNRGWRDARKRMERQKAGLQPVDDMLSHVSTLRLAKSWKSRRKNALMKAGDGTAPTKKAELPKVFRTNRPVKKNKPVEDGLETPTPIEDRAPGWEVREYMTKLCRLAEVPRPANEQWHLLAHAQKQLRARQEQPRASLQSDYLAM